MSYQFVTLMIFLAYFYFLILRDTHVGQLSMNTRMHARRQVKLNDQTRSYHSQVSRVNALNSSDKSRMRMREDRGMRVICERLYSQLDIFIIIIASSQSNLSIIVSFILFFFIIYINYHHYEIPSIYMRHLN